MTKNDYESDWGVPEDAPAQNAKQPQLSGNYDYEKDWQSDQPKMVDTFLGKMPKEIRELKLGTPENKEYATGLMNANMPAQGMNVVGKAGPLIPKMAGNLQTGIKSVLTKIAPKELAYGIQKAHDKLSAQASDIYNFIKSEVGPRGVSKIDIAPDLIEQAAQHMPKTQASKNLIDAARSGDYEALHELQSDLGKRGFKAKGADSYADRNIGDELLEIRDKINSAIRDKFKEHGHEDLAKMLDEAKNKYRYLKETYYDHPAIAKLVGHETRKMPANPMRTFSEESKPMEKVLEAHPEVKKAVETARNAKDFIKKLKIGGKLGIGSGIVGGSIYGFNALISALNTSQSKE